ncbi:restriction endonuclease subunit S [Achromobacter kerstersii]|uniref:restriction endonuclease subunit S n=1 Tax=Achromobacter kerstersii TaxID=1353890 RepID=UPI00320948DB
MPLEDWMAAIIDYRGKTPRKTTSGIPLVTAKIVKNGRIEAPEEFIAEADYDDWMRRGIPEPGDVVLTTEAPLGEVAQLDGTKIALAQRIITLRGKPDLLDNTYLRFALQSGPIQEQLRGRASGSTVSGIKQSELRKLTLRFPPVDEQRRVAAVLVTLDDKIDVNRRINQTLEAMAQAIFKSWFVDFDPVKAKIAAIEQGQDPLRVAMRAISGKTDTELDQLPREYYDQLAVTAALFPDAMKESELGDIPKGWTHGVLGDVCSFTAGSAFKPEHQGSTEGDYPFIKVSDMNLAGNEVFIQSANNYVSKAQQSEMKAKLHPLGATVFAKIGVALISNRRRLLTTPTIIDNNLMSASPVESKSGAYFLYSMLSTIDFNTLVSGTALPYINVSDLKKIPIVRPPHDVGFAFERKASSIFSMMQALAAQSSTLADTRDNLLPKLMSGEVEFSETLEG